MPGEAAGPDSMKTALSFGTKRIGHGIAAIDDPELIKRLIDENVTLEVCVTSNYHTKSSSGDQHAPDPQAS